MSKEYNVSDPKLDASNRQKIIDDSPMLSGYFKANGTVKKEGTYRKVCRTYTYNFPGSKLFGVEGVVDIACKDVSRVMQQLMIVLDDVDESSPKALQKSVIAYRQFYWDDADRRGHDAVVNDGEFRPYANYMHSVLRSPMPAIVKHRDFVGLGRLYREEESGDIVYVRESVDAPAHANPKVVRSQVVCNCFRIHLNEDKETVRLTNSTYADPCGQIPTGIINMVMDQAFDYIVLVKDLVEGKTTLK